MPTIIQYNPDQVGTEIANQPVARDAPVGAFGTEVAQGVSRVAQSAINIKKRIDTTSAEEALVTFEREKNDLFFNPETGYFNTQGRNAFDASQPTVKALAELKKKHGQNLNIESRSLFDKAADTHITRGNMDVARHSSKGLQAWEVATLEAQVENSIENGSLYWNDPERVRINRALGRQAVIDSGEMQGLDSEVVNENLQTFDSAFSRSIIESAIQKGSDQGKEALKKYGDMLEGPDKVKMDTALERKVKVEKTENDAKAAITTATRLVDQYDTRAEIIEQINNIKDPELRKKTLTEATTQFNRKKTAEKEIETEFYNQGIEHFNEGGTAEGFKASNPEAWEGMSSRQRNNLLAGKHMTTDQIQFNTVLSLPRSQLSKINPVDYVDIFNPSDMGKLRSAVDKAQKGKPVTTIQTASSKVNSVAEQFFGKRETWKGNKIKSSKVQELMEEVQSRIQEAEDEKDGKLLPSEIDEIVNEYSRTFVVERSFGGFDFLAPDFEIDISTTSASNVAELSSFVDAHGEDSLQKIIDLLQENDKPVTVPTILKAFRQATQ